MRYLNTFFHDDTIFTLLEKVKDTLPSLIIFKEFFVVRFFFIRVLTYFLLFLGMDDMPPLEGDAEDASRMEEVD